MQCMTLGMALLATVWAASAQEGTAGRTELPVRGMRIVNASAGEGMVGKAIERLEERVRALGGAMAEEGEGLVVLAGEPGASAAVSACLPAVLVASHTEGLAPFQQREGWFLALTEQDGAPTLCAAGLSPLGAVYAVSELELRLRVRDGEVFLAFPEWADEGTPRVIFDAPAIAGRGEYLNIGYNLQQITPHEWDAARWRAYIDELVLAKLNRFYYYLWIDTCSMNPASELSERPLNRQIHERVQEAIAYAKLRGLDVTYMFCPSYFPKDIWEAHPEMQADIEYVEHGFPAVCSRAPGAWEMMLENARSEFAWFKEADAIQLWFYDPGGCWCERNGCKAHQAETLARQVTTFSALFREFNPEARVEFNYWPMWLWEDIQGIKYREDMDRRIKEAFGAAHGEVTAVGAPDADFTLPLIEEEMGFQTGVFLFGTNPERSYVFVNPQLAWMRDTSRMLLERGMDAVFGHRLEAWTRLPQTFLMAQYLWDPSATPESVAAKLAERHAADPELGARLTQALLDLDRFSTHGADAALGARMAAEMRAIHDAAPAGAKADLELYVTTTAAMDVIAQSMDADEEALEDYARRFAEIMEGSASFGAWTGDWPRIFENYRTWLIEGWNTSHF